MSIQTRQNPSDTSSLRVSLLMRLLNAEGPGTVIWKRYADDCVYDRSSHDLLRSILTSYSFIPLPNAHYTKSKRESISKLHELLNSPETPLQKLYKGYAIVSTMHISNMADQFAAEPSKITYRQKIKSKYFVSQNGPIVICGSPEAFHGYRKTADRTNDEDQSELEELLNECGYSRTYAIELADNNKRETTIRQLSTDKVVSIGNGYDDLGLVFVGRTTQTKRLVVVLAGASSPYGTYAAVRIAMDAGRNEVNHGIIEFLERDTTSFQLLANVRPWLSDASRTRKHSWEKENVAFRSITPVDAKVVEGPNMIKCNTTLRSRKWEMTLAAKAPKLIQISRESTRLAEYLAEIGPISAMVKAFPGQIQLDASAKDLLEWLLPDTHFIPALGNAPRNPESLNLLDKAFDDELNAIENDDKQFMELLSKVDPEGEETVKSWAHIAKLMNNQGFRQACLEQYHLGSEPLVILGACESYLGFSNLDMHESSSHTNASGVIRNQSQLAELVNSINYPNRYRLIWDDCNGHTMLDQKWMEMLPHITEDKSNELDYGLVYLCRDLSERIVMVVAGLTSRGTTAGLQMMFAERRADIDTAITRFIEKKLESVEIGFVSTFTGEGKPYLVEPRTRDIQTLYKRNVRAEPFVNKLRQSIELRQSRKLDINDTCNSWQIDFVRDKFFKLTVKTQYLQITASPGGRPYKQFVSSDSLEYLRTLKEICGEAKKRVDGEKGAAHRLRVLVLAETGTGKESAAHRIHLASSPDGTYEVFNTSTFVDTLAMSEIFGHVAGAFTGATKDKKGLVEKAKFGSLFLDEFPLLSDSLQSGLNRFLQFGTYRKVGSEEDEFSPVTLILAASFAPNRAEFNKIFKEHGQRIDFAPRFQKVLSIPPLRERTIEILPTFVGYFEARHGCKTAYMTFEALQLLLTHEFEQNFRELSNAVENFEGECGTLAENPITKIQMAKVLCLGDSPYRNKTKDESPLLVISIDAKESEELFSGLAYGDQSVEKSLPITNFFPKISCTDDEKAKFPQYVPSIPVLSAESNDQFIEVCGRLAACGIKKASSASSDSLKSAKQKYIGGSYSSEKLGSLSPTLDQIFMGLQVLRYKGSGNTMGSWSLLCKWLATMQIGQEFNAAMENRKLRFSDEDTDKLLGSDFIDSTKVRREDGIARKMVFLLRTGRSLFTREEVDAIDSE